MDAQLAELLAAYAESEELEVASSELARPRALGWFSFLVGVLL